MKHRRILLSVLISLFLIAQPLSCLAVVAEYYPSFETQMTRALGKDFMLKMAAQDKAILAYETLLAHFSDSYGNIVYPAEYAGAYLVEDILHINLTDTSAATITKYSSLLHDYEEKISLDKVQYSYSYLCSLIKKIPTLISLPTSSSFYIDWQNNCISVVVPENSATTSINSTGNLPIRIEVSPEQITAPTAATTTTEVIAGDSLCINGSHNRTISACGWYNDEVAILTCGHWWDLEETAVNYNFTDAASNTMATTTVTQFSNGAAGDYAICYLNTEDFAATSKVYYYLDGPVHWQAGITYSLQGLYLVKYGYRAGFAGFTVSAENYSLTYAQKDSVGNVINSVTIHSMVMGENLVGNAIPGDSGGPIIRTVGNKYYFAGLQSGASYLSDADRESGNAVAIYVSPYSLIDDIFTLKTN